MENSGATLSSIIAKTESAMESLAEDLLFGHPFRPALLSEGVDSSQWIALMGRTLMQPIESNL